MNPLPSTIHLHKDNKIGEGAFGSVYRVCDGANCNLVLKVTPKRIAKKSGECEGTGTASQKHFAPHFYGCYELPSTWPNGENSLGLLMDLHGISLPDYLEALSSSESELKKRAMLAYVNLFKKIKMAKMVRDRNPFNYVIRECNKDTKGKNLNVLGIDWGNLTSNAPVTETEAEKQAEKSLQDLQGEIAKFTPQEKANALEKLAWLRSWETC